MRVAIIINPNSGFAKRREAPAVRRQIAERVLSDLGVTADVRVTERRGHAADLVRDVVDKGADVVGAWGGDGTLNEVASALAFGPVPVAIIPSGSGNGLARELGTPIDPAYAIRVAVEGRDRRLDAGDLNGRLFFNVAGIGFDAEVAHRFAGHARRGFGPYLAIAARHFWSYRPATYTMTVDGRESERCALMIVVANSRQYGNGAIIAPAAKPDDGELDLVVVQGRSRVATLVRVPRLFRGTLESCDAISMQRVRLLSIAGVREFAVHLDGEPTIVDEPLTIAVRQGAIAVRS